VRLNFLFFFIQKPSLATMSYHPPFSSSSDEVSDEDNHPEKKHWYERSPLNKRSRRGRGWRGGGGRRTANRSDSDSPKEESTDIFVHNTEPNDVVIPPTDKWWEEQERQEARQEAREARQDTAKKRRIKAEARREACFREDRYATIITAQMAARREDWIAAGWRPKAPAARMAARSTPGLARVWGGASPVLFLYIFMCFIYV
jgi:hypothetical protein